MSEGKKEANEEVMTAVASDDGRQPPLKVATVSAEIEIR